MASATHIFEDPRPSRQSPVKESSSKHHKRTPSVGAFLRGRRLKENDPSKTEPVDDSRQTQERPLAERHINSPPNSRRVPLRDEDGRSHKTHKKTKSAVSLRSLMGDKKSDSGSLSSSEDRPGDYKPKKSKSSTNLGALLKKRSSKALKEQSAQDKPDKENAGRTTPPQQAQYPQLRSPIWEQFATQPATQPFEYQFGQVLSPERRGRTITEELTSYNTKNYDGVGDLHTPSPLDYMPPTPLSERSPERPKLEHKSSRSSIFKEEELDTDRPTSSHFKSEDLPKSSVESTRPSMDQPRELNPKRSSRVMSALNSLTRNKESPKKATQSEPKTPLSPQEIDAAFENVLESRNIPQNMREKMRAMDLKIKADFVKSHRVESGSSNASATEELRPSSRSPVKSQSPRKADKEQIESKRSRSRPRSLAFTLSKGDKSPKKQNEGYESTRGRPKSIEIVRPGSSRSLTSSSSHTSLSSLNRHDAAASPQDFIHYLREIQKPEIVEVGKMHKLRILLRNETVQWTDAFITQGGMDEIVQLLYRIMKVEWREDHEDTLLHETLLCLKALCTTQLALQHLTKIEATLFPALLSMLFDPERKGPAEFSTRGIIISILFMHLSAALALPAAQLTGRARVILSYLQDPTPEESKQPLPFISQMHISRPYRVWCKEVVNVTKEVFWIFLHHLNVIPLVENAPRAGYTPYVSSHFPTPPPPHPAAPYVGGVEWEATLYLSTHLDLLNGLIASLPTQYERNALRQELKDSGFEKIMGATMRTAKEKFYGHLHSGLRCWVAAAKADAWAIEDVKEGPPRETVKSSPKKKGTPEQAPPRLDIDLKLGAARVVETKLDAGGWI